MSGAARLGRLLAGVRDMLRLLSPAVRAERNYTFGRERLIAEASRCALAGSRAWMEIAAGAYGPGFDERVVEYPWLYAHLDTVDRMLDVGAALNHAAHIALLGERCGRIVFLNPYRDEGYRSCSAAVRYVRADARAPALRPGSFARVTCISTLEHVGCDNTRYGGPQREAPDEPDRARAAAMRAMRVLLAPGGRLLLTVPFGRREDHGWHVQLDAAMLAEAVAAFGPTSVEATYFLHENGWRRVPAESCADARYGERTRGASAVACLELAG